MRRADQIAGVGFLAFAAAYAGAALRWYSYWGDTGPGPGFLPVWLGLAMAILAALLTVQSSRAGARDGAWLPTGKGLARLLVVLGATALLIALINVTGMILGTGLFLLGILRFLEGYPWSHTLGIAAGTALVNYLVFTYWLQVPFPIGYLGF
jgi:putative tricarboxylic transport membrane protein